jgi:MFS family permease
MGGVKEQAAAVPLVPAGRDWRVLIGAQLVAQAADGFAQAGFADALVLEPLGQRAPGRILALFALTLLPYSVISPFLGVFVDRWRRRNLLIGTNVARAELLLSLPTMRPLVPGDGVLYGVALALLGLGRLFLTTKSAVLPVVLHEHHLLRGNAISGGGGMIAALAGGIVGLWAVGTLGQSATFVVAGLAYALAAAAARLLSGSTARPRPHAVRIRDEFMRVARELAAGLREIAIRVRVRLSLAAIFLLRTVAMFVAIAAILVITEEFPNAGDRFARLSTGALALGAAGIGAFVGAATTPTVGRRLNKASLVLLGFAVSALGLVSLGSLLTLPAMLGVTFLGGYGAFVGKIAVDALVQESLPDHFRGRAFALYDILYNLASVVAALVMVALAAQRLSTLLVVAGAVTLVAASALAVAMRRAGMLAAAPET